MIRNYFILTFLAIGILSCNTPAEKLETAAGEENVEATTPQTTQEPANIPPLPQDKWMAMMTTCSSLDITFYTMSFSISASSCSQLLPFIERSVPTRLVAEEFGHILFLINGEKFSIAKVILSENSNYLKFDLDGKDYYQNLSPSGVAYFRSIEGQFKAENES